MSNPIDWEQFKRKEPNTTRKIIESAPKRDTLASPQNALTGQTDWSQYKRKPAINPKEMLRTAGRSAVQYGASVLDVASPITLAATAAPRLLANINLDEVQNRARKESKQLQEKRDRGEKLTWQEEKYFNRIKDIAEKGPTEFPDVTPGGLLRQGVENITGESLEPENAFETAASWAGFLKDPKKIMELGRNGINVGEISKALFPTAKEFSRSIGAGMGIEAAKDNEFGPIGTMAAAVAGDLLGGGIQGAVKGAINFAKNPKQSLANLGSKFVKADQLAMQKQIIQDFRSAGIQADFGSITGSNLMRVLQARLAASGLTGPALKNFTTKLTSQIIDEYKGLADSIGTSRLQSSHEAGEVLKQSIDSIRRAEGAEISNLYKATRDILKDTDVVHPVKLASSISKLKRELSYGSVKSVEQQKVLDVLEKIEKDIYDAQGNLKPAKVKDLINNKQALNEIIDYEVLGGQKQLLKGVVGDLDRAIVSHGNKNPQFARNYVQANKRFSQHAKTFRNRSMKDLLKVHDPATLLNKMNNIQGIRDIKNILLKTPEGTQLFNDLRRFKLDELIGKKMVDSTTNQLKFGTFSKLLEKGKNTDLIRELLGRQDFDRLSNLMRGSGRLAESMNKFLNTSQTASVAFDVTAMGKVLKDLAHIASGNPWPLMRTGGAYLGIKGFSKLITDPEFLRLTEEAILASKQNNPKRLETILKLMESPVQAAIHEESKNKPSPD